MTRGVMLDKRNRIRRDIPSSRKCSLEVAPTAFSTKNSTKRNYMPLLLLISLQCGSAFVSPGNMPFSIKHLGLPPVNVYPPLTVNFKI